MGQYHLRVNSKGFSAFDSQGRHRLTSSDEQTKVDSAAVNLNVADPARITTQSEQMNPLGRHVASSIVSPQPTWLPIVPDINIAMTMIFAIVAAVYQIEDDSNESSSSAKYLGKPVRRTDYQIFNFEDFLPENVSK